MADFHLPPEIIDGARAIGSTLAPGAVGAAISQAYKPGLKYGQRLVQIMVGIGVSYFASLAIGAIFAPGPLLAQSITFALGMVAYEATPRFMTRTVDVVAELPAWIIEKALSKKDLK
jgi:hypothetical protein